MVAALPTSAFTSTAHREGLPQNVAFARAMWWRATFCSIEPHNVASTRRDPAHATICWSAASMLPLT